MELAVPIMAVSCDLFTSSKKGQLPFVELNGKEIPDSNFIIEDLTKHFKKEGFDSHLNPVDRAVARAFESLVEDTIYWVVMSLRSGHVDQLLNDNAMLRIFPAPLRPVRVIASRMMANKLKTKSFHQGIGRHTTTEIIRIGQEALRSFSVFLGEKAYLMGDKPTKVDAASFGHLSQLWYTPIETDLKKYLESDCQNVVKYLERIKSAYWADWADLCRVPAKPVKEKSAENTEAKEEANVTTDKGKATDITEQQEGKQEEKKSEEKPDEKAKDTSIGTIAPVAELPAPQRVAVEAQ
ncbi:unnamed protein product [Soboliphyme baturini]|uniref:GST_C_6 domain-containing protein n=1 Tax=Soboliphyme baturini TaxID=241478 RepID=A0A183J8J7_9BILA|nr:unnamed protein product [Soboliphyme baturini]